MKYVSFLLHAYQPPWQFDGVIEQITDECYLPLFNFLADYPADFTVNINYSLLEKLERSGYGNLIKKIKSAVKSGHIELTGSGAYHPIFPLIPADEADRQIILNKQGIRKVLGQKCGPGFFPPEMAYSENIIPSIKKNGYLWTITDDIPFCQTYGHAPYDFIPSVSGCGVVLRSSMWSKKIALETIWDEGEKCYRKATAKEIVSWLHSDLNNWFGDKKGYVVIAMDIETFGHHIKEYRYFLRDFQESLKSFSDMELTTISNLMKVFPLKEIYVPSGSWSTSAENFKEKDFYPLWKSPGNQAQLLLWELLELGLKIFNKNNPESRKIMDQAMNSCQFWWLTPGDHYNPELGVITAPRILEVIRRDNPDIFWKAEEILFKLKNILHLK